MKTILLAAMLVMMQPVLGASFTVFFTGQPTVEVPVETGHDTSVLLCVPTPEAQRAYLITINDEATFLASLYAVMLYRPIDEPGKAYWHVRLLGYTRGQVIDQLMTTPEYKALHVPPKPAAPNITKTQKVKP